ncbi:hypothetical protein JCM19233_6169 [Vibrio astriarenae]|nr:hypothetical protein JCM19233_6169 [Vibrio sp. C7]
MFPNPITSVGEIDDRIQEFKATHVLIGGGWHPDLMVWSAIDYLLEKQEFHSLTEVEAIELERLQREHPNTIAPQDPKKSH